MKILTKVIINFCLFLTFWFIGAHMIENIMVNISNEEIHATKTHQTYSKPIEWIEGNPIYSALNIPTPKARKRVTLLVIVSSSPHRVDRRQGIRQTWWTDCVPKNEVVPECIFLTDVQHPSSQYYNITQLESSLYGDLKFQNLQGGFEFGARMMYHMVFAMKNYNFDYLLRIDDDYFLCLKSFLQELPMPMEPSFLLGWIHRMVDTMVRPDEGFVLFSNDVIEKFLSQDPSKMKCHPLADIMIAEWAKDLNMRNIFHHDNRVHHVPVIRDKPSLRNEQNICSKYIALHGCYHHDMLLLWEHRGTINKRNGTLKDHSTLYAADGKFDWKMFIWRFEPKLCITNPTWDTSTLVEDNGHYGGREDN